MPEAHSNSTLSDVAREANVSVSTASRVLNGLAEKYRISRATAQLVRDSADKLGFRPSQVARSLRLKRTGLFGIIVPDLSNPFFSSIARSVTVAAEAEGFSAILADSGGSVEKEKNLIDQLTTRSVEALIVCPVGLDFEHLENVHQQGIPLVVVDRCKAKSSMVQVTSDHITGTRTAMDLLLRNGHRHIGVLQGIAGTLPCDQRLQGVKEALAEVGVRLHPVMVAGNEFSYESGYESARKLLTTNPQITALFAMSTPNAFGAYQAAIELGLRVPDDLSLVCFDDVAFADFMQVPLTTVSQDVLELGRLAASLVIDQLSQGKSPVQKMHKVPVTLLNRASVGKMSLS
ncbi:HTH-type transcriptional repressor CytR [Bremerella volcania]|uniref:HTH-type transcriptional repressor CytR n=1 Tax=Bremerella volcania TaxID=2527984 RepID=A0A518C909_9BACT|nr:LacI family DNA-binding transcriptional regulator [Bremerella volcania]QDU75674.1 HTH-type transcriptional repressor CytR [Bremerella volcania]